VKDAVFILISCIVIIIIIIIILIVSKLHSYRNNLYLKGLRPLKTPLLFACGGPEASFRDGAEIFIVHSRHLNPGDIGQIYARRQLG